MSGSRRSARELIPGFRPEDELERAVTEDPALLEGLSWGEPRRAHPEGPVGAHVSELLSMLEEWKEPEPRRSELRLIAIVHDSFKYQVDDGAPKTGENHHAVRARRFAERYTDDERLLAAIELHDRPYALWRRMRRTGGLDEEALTSMLRRVPDPALLLRFVELDGSSAGKNPDPVRWFRAELERRGVVPAARN